MEKLIADKNKIEVELKEVKMREAENQATIKTLRDSYTESRENTRLKEMKVISIKASFSIYIYLQANCM